MLDYQSNNLCGEPNVCSQPIVYNDGFSEKWIHQLSPAEWRDNVDVEFRHVPLSRLEHAECWSDPAVVSGWTTTLVNGGSIPPPVVTETHRGTYYLHDGNHRYLALREYLERDGADPAVRVAVAVPNPRYRFVYKRFDEYGTYVIEKIPRRFTLTAQLTAAIVASVAATAITIALSRAANAPVFVLFVVSVMMAAWVAGLLAGLVATAGNVFAAAYFLLPPNRSLLIQNEGHATNLGISAFSMIGVALFIGWIRQHRPIELGLPWRETQSCHPDERTRAGRDRRTDDPPSARDRGERSRLAAHRHDSAKVPGLTLRGAVHPE